MHKRKRGTHPAVGALRTRGAQNNPYKNRVAVLTCLAISGPAEA